MTVFMSMTVSASANGLEDWLGIPEEEDFRLQIIEKQANETDWPFVSDRGYLACAPVMGKPQGFFIPLDENNDVPEGQDAVPLSGHPVEMLGFMLEDRDKFREMGSLEELIRRVAPIADTARLLCKQPRGAEVPFGEL